MKQLSTRIAFASLLLASSAQAQEILFTDGFEDGVIDTTLSPGWRIRTNLLGTGGSVNVANITTCSGQFLARIGKSVDDGAFTRNALDLHIDLSGQDQVDLLFNIVINSDETNPADGLYFSQNGDAGPFSKVLDFLPQEYCNNTCGQFPPVDVDALASEVGLQLTSDFVIRFQQFDNDDFVANFNDEADGIYLDNVSVIVPVLQYASVPFGPDGFESGEFESHWAWNYADNTCDPIAPATAVTGISNAVRVIPSGNGTSFCAALGKNCQDPQYRANALDLHLDLSSVQSGDELVLKFRTAPNFDETDELRDALFFSDDGGDTLVKVMDLKPGGWCNIWGTLPPINLTQLALENGLDPTSSEFVIRFQQFDNADFVANFNDESDGLYIDDVEVTLRGVEYATVPFFDGFETNQSEFGPAWSWSWADSTALPATNVTKISGYVLPVIGLQQSGQYKVEMGKRCQGDGFIANALDLHLDLEDATNAGLVFHLWSFTDEPHIQDGLWFSNNGGDSFQRAYGFDTLVFPNAYRRFALSISDLAAALTPPMALTDSFIVRFQQYDDADFVANFNDERDGYLLDSVYVAADFNTGFGVDRNVTDLRLNPNPTNGIVSLTLKQASTGTNVLVTNTLGQPILTLSLNGNQRQNIDLTPYENGVYFVEVRYADGTRAVERIVKQ